MSTTIKREELTDGRTFKSDLLIDDEFILLPAQVPVTEKLIQTVAAWNFDELSCEDTVQPETSTQSESQPEEKTQSAQNDSTPKTQPQSQTQQQSAAEIEQQLAKKIQAERINDSETARLEAVQRTYQEYMTYINSVYTHFATHKEISLEQMTESVKSLCVFIKDNKRYVLRISPSIKARSKNFLVVHSMRSTVLAITIGFELHLPLTKLIELGITCILHEIGMLRLPPQLYMTDRPLSAAEKAQITMHPLYSLNILKEQNFPLPIQLGALEHHEKENGNGYPRHLTGDKISEYAKIISVACSFEAITAPRVYKTERTTFDAMVELLHNPNNQYDGKVIKALLFSLSLFPVGSYVYLNNGKIGLITDVTPNNPKNPIVQLVNERESDGSLKTIQSDDGQNKIIRVLSKEEQDDVVKSLQIQREAENKLKQQKQTEIAEAMKSSAQKKESDDGFSSVDLSAFD